MHQLQQCFRGLKMNQQVIIFGFIIMAIVLLIILGTCFVQASILLTAIQSSSQVITTKQEKRSIESTNIRIQDYLKRKYYEGILQIKEMEQRMNVSNQLFSSCEKPYDNHQKQKYTQQIIYLQLEIKEKGKYDSQRNINNLNEQLQMAIEEYKKLQDQIQQKRKSFEDMNQELVIAQKMMMKQVLDLETKLIENYTSLTLIEPNIFADHATSDKFDTFTLYQQTVSSAQASVPVPLQLQKAIPKPQQSQDEKKSDIIINSFKIVIRSNYPSK